MRFYYFVASLPALSLGAPAPVSMDAFRADAARLLPSDAVAEVEAVLAGDRAAAASAFASKWFAAETQLRNAVVRTRAARAEVDAAPFLRDHRGFRVSVEDAVLAAYGKPNPLEREMALDRFRWGLADELAAAAPFGLEAVLAYALKLQMAARWAGLTDEAGREALLAAVKAVRDRAGQAPAA